MEVALRSRANVRKLFELLTVIQSTRWDLFLSASLERTNGAVDYHAGPCDERAIYFYCELWQRCKVEEDTAIVRSISMLVIPKDLWHGWVHEDRDVECTSRHQSRDYNAYVTMCEGISQ